MPAHKQTLVYGQKPRAAFDLLPGEGDRKFLLGFFQKADGLFLSSVQRLELIEQLGQGTLKNGFMSLWDSLYRYRKDYPAMVW